MERRSRLLTSILEVAFYLNFLKAYSEGNLQSQYVGCYADNSSKDSWVIRVRNSSTMTLGSCIHTCRENRTTYAILQNGKTCMCGEVLNTSFPSNTCQIPCTGDRTEVCGGSNETMPYYVVYTVCPVGYYGAGCDRVCHCKQFLSCHRLRGICPNGCENSWAGETCNKESDVSSRYIGCYTDDERRTMTTYRYNHYSTNSIERCSSTCSSKNATYLGLQYDSHCFCGESYDRYGTSTKCNMSCSGNSGQNCGGYYANSVYSVCPKGSYGKDCVAQCNCNNADICPYSTGLCIAGCKPGWSGSSCSDRDCSRANGACSTHEQCVTTNLTFASVSRCHCSPGFQRTSIWNKCTDIDECNISYCESQTTICTNTIGSFVCNCKNGYKIGRSKTFCEDIDECNVGYCERHTTTCTNTIGSFVCNCKNGYKFGRSKTFCEDTDECKVGLCDKQTTTCNNTVGSFVCNCKNGYNPGSNKTFCEDIDECQSGYLTSMCYTISENCVNTIGSYRCECKDGFRNESRYCVDVDECQSRASTCNPATENCVNNIGSYICECKDDFVNILGNCLAFSSMVTIGILLGTLFAICLLINAFFAFDRIKGHKQTKPETGTETTLCDLKSRSAKLSDKRDNNCDGIAESADPNNIYEEIVPEHLQNVQNTTSEYLDLQVDDYLNDESCI